MLVDPLHDVAMELAMYAARNHVIIVHLTKMPQPVKKEVTLAEAIGKLEPRDYSYMFQRIDPLLLKDDEVIITEKTFLGKIPQNIKADIPSRSHAIRSDKERRQPYH